MRLNSHAGHGKQDSKSCGAYTNLLKESVENRDVNKDFINYMKKDGHTVFDCTVDYPASQNDCINQIVKKCNANKNIDLDVSIHFNAGRSNTGGDGKIGGVEVVCYDNKGTSKAYAERICKELNKLGFTNRGVKYNTNLGYLRNTNAQAIIVEVCFVDDKDDVILYNKVKSQIGKAIAQGVLNKTLSDSNQPPSNNTSSTVNYTVKVLSDSLNVRSGPSTDYQVTTTIKKGEVYTIIEEKSGWGKLKSGAGWINVSSTYVEKRK